jgi:TfoX/Sxy family transcriptional regulator of competence genes
MATERKFIDGLMDKMLPLEVTPRAMFGEYGLYYEGKNFALVCDNTLFVKITEPGAVLAGRNGKGSPYPGAKPAFKISPARLNSHDWLVELIKVTSEALPLPQPKKSKRIR